jgi:predicted O-methyltransferase YrrM
MTPKEQWTAVDRYICDLLVGADPALDQALADSAAAGLPNISVSPNQGKLLYILARTIRARRILEIGTLGGYSTIWLARAIGDVHGNDGRLITLEYERKHAAVAQKNIQRAELGEIVEIRIGPALETLPKIAAEMKSSNAPPFDLIFIDADKQSTAEYFDWALKLSRRGSLIIVDNVVRNGAVIEASSDDAAVQGVRRFHERLASEPRISATAIQTVGCKGYDGFAVALVTSE